jgi:general secretion pathway protein D
LSNNKKISAFILIFFFMLSSLAGCTSAPAQENPQEEQQLVQAARQMRQSNNVQLNFSNLEVSKFLRFMSELLNENIVVDSAVGGTVSVVSPKAISMREAREVMLSVLEMNNLSIQNMGGYSKVFPASAGPTLNNNVIKGDRSIAPGESLTVQVVPLRYVKSGYITEPLKSAVPDVSVTTLENGSSVLLTGKASSLSRALSVIRALDSLDSIRSIKVFNLNHANPKSLEAQLNAMSKDTSSKLSGILAVGDERTRRVVLIGSSQALRESERVLKILDVPSRAEIFHVYRLINADAKVVAEQMNSILATAAKLSPDPKGAVPSSVVPDLPTNSLVFTASQEQFNSIKDILVQLDIQPKQVLLRGLIAEVNINKLNSAGIDWAAWGGGIAGDAVIAGNVLMGSSTIPGDVLGLYEKLITKEEIKTDDAGFKYKTTNTDGKALIYTYIKMLNKFDAINVLSMPRLMCTDNLKSSLQVGQVIPQLKGALTDISNPRAVQNTYEYKDVGLILSVTPHVRSGNLVALEIEQRVEDLLTTMGSPTPVTSKREVKTNVLVANGDTIIIGGLIREAEKVLKNRVPFFSYIPLIGNLFKSSEKQREKVDLMIFLTPYILEDPKAASNMTYSIINGGQELSQAEKGTIRKNYDDYQKSVGAEGVPKELLDPNHILSGDKKEESTESKYNKLVIEMEAKEKEKSK